MKLLIEGNISAGKSSLIKVLISQTSFKNVKILDSGNNFMTTNPEYNLLKLFKTNPYNWSFLLQYTFLNFLSYVQETQYDKNTLSITSRSMTSAFHVFTKYYYYKGYITDQNMYILKNRMLQLIRKSIPFDVMVFIDVGIEVLSQRRSTSEVKYLAEDIAKYYSLENFLPLSIMNNTAKNYIILNGNKPLKELHTNTEIKNYGFPKFKTLKLMDSDIYLVETYRDLIGVLELLDLCN